MCGDMVLRRAAAASCPGIGGHFRVDFTRIAFEDIELVPAMVWPSFLCYGMYVLTEIVVVATLSVLFAC